MVNTNQRRQMFIEINSLDLPPMTTADSSCFLKGIGLQQNGADGSRIHIITDEICFVLTSRTKVVDGLRDEEIHSESRRSTIRSFLIGDDKTGKEWTIQTDAGSGMGKATIDTESDSMQRTPAD